MDMLPEQTMLTRDEVLGNILEGDELILFRQKRLKNHIECALWELSLMSGADYTDLMRDIVYVMIPDGNLLVFNYSLYFAVRRKIDHILKYAPDTSPEQICDLLTEMQSYANAYDEIVFAKPGIYKYTTPWFDHIEEDTLFRELRGCLAGEVVGTRQESTWICFPNRQCSRVTRF